MIMYRKDASGLGVSVKKLFDLQGKVALVTGGAGFLGQHFASALAELGARVYLLDLNESDLSAAQSALSALGFEVDYEVLDITSKGSISNCIEKISASEKSIDILINSAAFAMKNLQEADGDFFASFEDYDADLWQMSIDVNLTGTFLVCQAVGRVMRANQKGSIVNIASDVALISPDHRIYQEDPETGYKGTPFNTPLSYSASKAGVLAISRYLATYWAPNGVRVNSISPAGVFRNQDSEFIEELSKRIPLGRMAFAEELKGAIAYLASDASTFVTGSNLIVDGGRTIW